MDGLTIYPIGGTAGPGTKPQAAGMPAESPVPMPEQRLDDFDNEKRRAFVDPKRSRSEVLPRIVVLGGAVAVTAFAIYEMANALKVAGLTPIEAVMLVLFAVNFGWIAVTFVSAAAGLALICVRRGRKAAPAKPIEGRTAVLMPTYNEDPERVFAAVEAMASGVAALGESESFDWFVLSDTTDPEIALAEEFAFLELRARFGSAVPLYYRRRRRNIARKAGNIADFCRRWGGAYDYMVVLDADSLVQPETIVELARRMDADPDAGLIQTIPRLVNGRTLLARLQQFAGRVYGPVIAGGLAWWSGAEGNYWGHNAIIRRKAFTEAAGLPTLSGKPPLGGHILSHDFVEAALIRRAGWTVRIAHDLDGSYEESPPSLVDLAVRDRRWCQGNLQHTRIIGARGLHWVSRFHLATGVASYLASLFWLLLILAGMALAVQAKFTPPDYFKEPYQIFPTWPVIDPELAFRLLALTAAVLLGPKIMGFGALLLDERARRKSGGVLRLTASTAFEVVLSALIAPIMMVIQCGIITSILFGRDSGWKPQRRDGHEPTLGEAFLHHRWHTMSGLVLAIAAYAVSPVMLAWLSPAILGLLLAAPISALTASSAAGTSVRRFGLLRIPEETTRPAIGRAARARRLLHRRAVAAAPDLQNLVRDDDRRRLHLALVDHEKERERGTVDPIEAVAAIKIAEARTLDEALSFLKPEERAIALATPSLFERLGELCREKGRSAA